jgi:hypothetical protein
VVKAGERRSGERRGVMRERERKSEEGITESHGILITITAEHDPLF